MPTVVRINESHVKVLDELLFVRTNGSMAAKRGAKKKPVKKDENLNIRLTTEQKAEIAAAAERAGLSASSWVLALALKEARNAEGSGGA
jgi:predicted HicB family RNase H-like nuclease